MRGSGYENGLAREHFGRSAGNFQQNILEPVSEMRAFFERIVYYSPAWPAAEQSETKFPAVSRRQTR
jgi:hypothetical protein